MPMFCMYCLCRLKLLSAVALEGPFYLSREEVILDGSLILMEGMLMTPLDCGWGCLSLEFRLFKVIFPLLSAWIRLPEDTLAGAPLPLYWAVFISCVAFDLSRRLELFILPMLACRLKLPSFYCKFIASTAWERLIVPLVILFVCASSWVGVTRCTSCF